MRACNLKRYGEVWKGIGRYEKVSCVLLRAAAGCCWLVLPGAGCCWLRLAAGAAGCHWLRPAAAGCCWPLQAAAGCCWLLRLLLAAAGSCWLLLASLLRCSVKGAEENKRSQAQEGHTSDSLLTLTMNSFSQLASNHDCRYNCSNPKQTEITKIRHT